ncbi:MFS general substrate transporter [Neoconidiobolus thromboides FSU 785]|nr:MFS general substrate transporter [Neoconidiobolus thromboides FSU 785]
MSPTTDHQSQESAVKQPTPIPWRQVSVMLLVRFSEPISFTLLLPFVYSMVRDFHITNNEKDVAYYAGFIASSFAICQFVSGIPWGALSDRIGRKPVIVMGLLGTSINLFLFGLSKSLTWAVITRGLCGLLNGNIGVLKAMVAEITDSSNRAYTFNFLPMIYGLGSIIGPILGGYLSDPIQQYPGFFTNPGIVKLLTEYPYFLPCFVSSSLCLISSIIGLLFLKETLPKKVKNKQNDETSPLLNNETNDSPSSSSNIPIPKSIWLTITAYCGIGLFSVMLDEIIPFWASENPNHGGLKFNPADIGFLNSFGGVILLLAQFFLFVPFQRRYGSLTALRVIFYLYIPSIFLYPLTQPLFGTKENSSLWFYLYFVTTLKTIGVAFTFAAVNILIMEASPKPILGRVSGIAQCLVSLMRSLGPYLTGMLFSWSLNNSFDFILLKFPFTWLVIVSIMLFTLIVSYCIPPPMIN